MCKKPLAKVLLYSFFLGKKVPLAFEKCRFMKLALMDILTQWFGYFFWGSNYSTFWTFVTHFLFLLYKCNVFFYFFMMNTSFSLQQFSISSFSFTFLTRFVHSKTYLLFDVNEKCFMNKKQTTCFIS